MLYSHDTMGLGHMRRNLLVAEALADCPIQPSILLLAGAPELTAFDLPSGVDCLTLPALGKSIDGSYHARRLALSLAQVIGLRAATLAAALTAFDPDVLIVDNVPRGAAGELESALATLRRGGRTRCVLGLRDILDEPHAVRREWSRIANEDAIHRYYDTIWVYGDPTVYDPVCEYGFGPAIAAKLRYTGYLDQSRRRSADDTADPLADLGLPPGRLALCLLGGGQDGALLAEAFAATELPPETNGLLVAGPHLPSPVRERVRARVAGQPRLRMLDFVPGLTGLVRRADRVIAMGGYNTVGEVLAFERHALIVPRMTPRREQLVRAERLRDLGLVDMLRPEAATPAALTAWLARDPGAPPRVRERIDLHGLTRLPRLLADLLDGAARSAAPPTPLPLEGVHHAAT
ncbi:MAG: glycosyltransferase [Chloroflexi bacterium]|nr:glycosyltransferase [Chloroflexota bacterium]